MDPTNDELEAVAKKMDAKAFADFRKGLEKAHFEEIFNHPNNHRRWVYDIPNNTLRWLMNLRLPTVDLIPAEDRALLYFREMSPAGRTRMMALVTSQNEPQRAVDPATGEYL